VGQITLDSGTAWTAVRYFLKRGSALIIIRPRTIAWDGTEFAPIGATAPGAVSPIERKTNISRRTWAWTTFGNVGIGRGPIVVSRKIGASRETERREDSDKGRNGECDAHDGLRWRALFVVEPKPMGDPGRYNL
jgi:hypothetical protein